MREPGSDNPEHLTISESRGRTITRVPVKIKLYEVTEEQLDSLTSNDYGLWVSLAGACLGAGLTAFVAWLTAEFKVSLVRELFTGGWMALFILTLLLSYAGFRGFRKHRKQVKRIKRE